MANKWGSRYLNVTRINGDPGKPYLVERELLVAPDATSTRKIMSFILGSGRRRKQVSISGWEYEEDFKYLVEDYEDVSSNRVILEDGTDFTGYIWSLKATKTIGVEHKITFYDITFIEAGTSGA